jgi:hypothetical protein
MLVTLFSPGPELTGPKIEFTPPDTILCGVIMLCMCAALLFAHRDMISRDYCRSDFLPGVQPRNYHHMASWLMLFWIT